MSIGRTKDNDIALRDTRVSVFHAEITGKADGKYLLTDLGSHNGTVVNGSSIDEKVLEDGDEIKFGSVKGVYIDRREKAELAPEKSAQEIEAAGLMRKSEIERNNLKLIEADCKRVRGVIDDAQNQKTELKAELNRLASEIDKAKADLSDKTETADEIATAIQAARVFEDNIAELEEQQIKRKDAYDELGKKISGQEQALKDLDLEGATRKRKELDAEQKRLSKEIELAGADLEKKKKQAEEAEAIFKVSHKKAYSGLRRKDSPETHYLSGIQLVLSFGHDHNLEHFSEFSAASLGEVCFDIDHTETNQTDEYKPVAWRRQIVLPRRHALCWKRVFL